MNEDSSEPDDGVSRRKVIELVVGCSVYVMAGGSLAPLSAVDADASVLAAPSIGLIKDLFGRLDSRWRLQALALLALSDIESDYFGDVWRDRPQDYWECMKTWPPEARQQAVDLLLPMVATITSPAQDSDF